MSTENKKWIDAQIKTYENAIQIAKRVNNTFKLEEYKKELHRLKST